MNHVLITTFPGAFMHDGGGEREIYLLNEALNHTGVISDIYGPASRSINAYQAVIHFSLVEGSEQAIASAVERGLRLILWPNLWFVEPPAAKHIVQLVSLLRFFHAVVFRSRAEETQFSRYLDLSGKDIIRISPLISARFQRKRKNVTDVFRQSYGLQSYAIWPGIIEPQKNQLAAVRAFNELPVDLIISGEARDQAYAAECRRQAKGNITFIPPLPFGSELHLSALAYSQMVVELPFDFPGTSALEAAVVGVRLLLSRSEWTEEMLGPYCIQVDPANDDEICHAATRLLNLPYNQSLSPRSAAVTLSDAVAPLVNYLQSI